MAFDVSFCPVIGDDHSRPVAPCDDRGELPSDTPAQDRHTALTDVNEGDL